VACLNETALDNEEAVEQLEGQRRYREEVESDHYLAVILEEGQPPNRIISPEAGHRGASGAIQRRQRLGGMLNYYYRTAA